MAIEINLVTHDPNLIWLNRWKEPRRSWGNFVTIDGITIIQNSPIIDNRTIRIGTLNKNGFYGYWTEAQIEAIELLEQSGAIFNLTYHTKLNLNVVVIPGSIDMEQLTPSNTQGYGDAYIGSVDFKVS